MKKTYIGDSVYAEWIGFGDLALTTWNGLPGDPSNRIVIERSVWAALVAFVEHGEAIHRAHTADAEEATDG